MIGDYVREEALYREAKALQLDKNDYVARLRLILQTPLLHMPWQSAHRKR